MHNEVHTHCKVCVRRLALFSILGFPHGCNCDISQVGPRALDAFCFQHQNLDFSYHLHTCSFLHRTPLGPWHHGPAYADLQWLHILVDVWSPSCAEGRALFSAHGATYRHMNLRLAFYQGLVFVVLERFGDNGGTTLAKHYWRHRPQLDYSRNPIRQGVASNPV